MSLDFLLRSIAVVAIVFRWLFWKVSEIESDRSVPKTKQYSSYRIFFFASLRIALEILITLQLLGIITILFADYYQELYQIVGSILIAISIIVFVMARVATRGELG